jgi:methionyl-tRNA formyltransferase
MRVGFAGTPAFAAAALAAIHDDGHTIPVVLTQPDRPFGRGLAVVASPVKRCAAERGLFVQQPASLRGDAAQAPLCRIPIDVLVVAAYGLILPQAVLDWPRHGALNIHASLLPRWRGAAPIARAIEAGDEETGVTIMQMDAGLDTGPIVTARRIAIAARETTGTLTARLAELGAATIVEVLAALARDGSLAASPQPVEGVTYAAKITRTDSLVDWRLDARTLDRRIRALSPAPGAVAGWQGKFVKIHATEPIFGSPAAEPGTTVAVGAEGIDVACGAAGRTSVLRITMLQPAAGRAIPAHAFAAGHRVSPGARFEPGQLRT